MRNEHVVVGTGPLGLAIIDELLKQGKEVIAVNRSGQAVSEKVSFKQCDVTNYEQISAILKNAVVVYHCVGLPYAEWQRTLPTIMANLIAAAEEHHVKIVYADNLYAYGPQKEPFHEKMTYQSIGIKTRVRAEVANMLMTAIKYRKITATIGRGSDFYGPNVRNAMLGQRVFQHLLEGKPVELIGNPNQLHAHIYIKDFARGLVMLGDEPKADGEVWHIPHPTPMSTRQLVEEIADHLEIKPTYRIANKLVLTMMGMFNPVMKEFKEILYQNTQNFIVDSNKFTAYFPFQPTPYKQAIMETCEWYKQQNDIS
ncbi:NAD-dependent epimerase/dehydratase family protein [Lysinibacillus macroides]|uniref:NAD-dependent epimerase/dehydratase domain-containing protein n=1 Tax=Lysinibacillus macroides TaxID=33935 RepID=A0A0N0CWP0_9BACI|nr:NAD-dependent epimerase/dehydratase family protein [Lysinibacillus macroides]KOY83421.1 hypothetical protein ADM90_09165 [Lysinibacillus macroides]QPR69291.1 NAD-dependent epimerase/dehydratase family protein [Lysinibacillus macroides]